MEISLKKTTDFSLPAFDNTKLVALNTCPTWGLITYDQHKHMYDGRIMALEAGKAAHEFFAAHAYMYGQANGFDSENEGIRLFGEERFQNMLASVSSLEDFRTRMLQFSITALETSGFVDDDSDKKRTMANIEEMCIAYADFYDFNEYPPAVIDGHLCVEIPFDITITFDDRIYAGLGFVQQYRFIGKIDGLNWSDTDKTKLRVRENKTASKLGEHWENAFEVTNQTTGYQIAASCLFDIPINESIIYGTCLPLPKNIFLNGLARVPAIREQHHYDDWFIWFYDTVQQWEKHRSNPTMAPKYTHSCGRYFRTCSMIGLCQAPADEREDIMNNMFHKEWSPLHEEN